MAREKLPPEKRGKNADNPKTSQGRTDNTKPTRGMTKEERDDMTGRNPDKPIVGSDSWARKNNQPPYDK